MRVTRPAARWSGGAPVPVPPGTPLSARPGSHWPFRLPAADTWPTSPVPSPLTTVLPGQVLRLVGILFRVSTFAACAGGGGAS